MAGYNGFSRSNNSRDAINGFEMPISMINKNIIQNWLETDAGYCDFTDKQLETLKKTKVSRWKQMVKSHFVQPSVWHHTSSWYNKTDHYRLEDVAEAILEHADYNPEPEKTPESLKYGFINVQVWGGTRKHPKIEGEESQIGIVKGQWLYATDGKKYKTTANKVIEFKTFDDYSDLVKHYPKYKGSKGKLGEVKRKL